MVGSFYFLTADILLMPTATLTVLPHRSCTSTCVLLTEGFTELLVRWDQKRTVFVAIFIGTIPELRKRGNPQAKVFRDIQTHKWNHESHENRNLITIFFQPSVTLKITGSYIHRDHRLIYSQRFFIIFLHLPRRRHGILTQAIPLCNNNCTIHYIPSVHNINIVI